MVGKRYRVIETLGKGAFGTVYRAEVLGAGDFKKQVALKVLDYEGDAPEEIALRFRDEARILGLIRHRAVVGVDSLAELESGWAVVMEYVDGVDITSVVKYGLPPARVVVSIVEEVASALHAAWTTISDVTGNPLRLVHRDIKPANVRLTAQGEVKVLDFGVARAEFESREAHTQAMRFGSLRYMAPESFDGIEGHATDIFALGVVFGELLAGKRLEEPPKNPERYAAYLEAVIDGARARLDASLDEEFLEPVCQLVREMLAFEPDERPSGRSVERSCRAIAGRMPGPALRDWAEDYVPALAEKMTRRSAQKNAGDAPSSAILVEKSAAAVLESALPESIPGHLVDRTDVTRTQNIAIASSAVFGFGAAMLAVVVIGIGVVLIWPSSEDADSRATVANVAAADQEVAGINGSTQDGDAADDGLGGSPADTPESTEGLDGDGTAEASEGEANEQLDEDGQRTIVIARGANGQAGPAPEPTQVKVSKVAPKTAPKVTPKAAPEPVAGGSVALTGDATSVSFVSSTGSAFSQGQMPAGTYRIMAVFPGSTDAIQAGTVSVRDGGSAAVNCTALMFRCSAK